VALRIAPILGVGEAVPYPALGAAESMARLQVGLAMYSLRSCQGPGIMRATPDMRGRGKADRATSPRCGKAMFRRMLRQDDYAPPPAVLSQASQQALAISRTRKM
jgi:hypothetical protein